MIGHTEFLSAHNFDDRCTISVEHIMQPLNVRETVLSPKAILYIRKAQWQMGELVVQGSNVTEDCQAVECVQVLRRIVRETTEGASFKSNLLICNELKFLTV